MLCAVHIKQNAWFVNSGLTDNQGDTTLCLAIMDPFDKIWNDAWAHYKETLSSKQLEQLLQTRDYNSLLDKTRSLRERYNERGTTRAFDRINRFLSTINTFSEVVKVFLQADPRVFALIWGSVSFVLEVWRSPATLLLRGQVVAQRLRTKKSAAQLTSNKDLIATCSNFGPGGRNL